MIKEWRCFHCDEVFTDDRAAMAHFGKSEHREAACQVDVTLLRELEDQVRSYQNEDTELYREIARLRSDHATALRREEEKGYEKGLRDLRPVCEALSELVTEIEESGTRAFELDGAHEALAMAGFARETASEQPK